MEPVEHHLCMVIDRATKAQLWPERVVQGADWYFARNTMANLFRLSNPHEARDWCVDSVQIEPQDKP